MLKKTTEQLELHKSEETSSTFFDTVIFSTNVPYADGHFKGGSFLFLFLFSSLSYNDTLTVLPEVDLASRSIETADTDPVKVQSELAVAWLSLIPDFPANNIHVLPSIEHAIRVVREIESRESKGGDVIVTGSLRLVGGVIKVAGLSGVTL